MFNFYSYLAIYLRRKKSMTVLYLEHDCDYLAGLLADFLLYFLWETAFVEKISPHY